ncbi:MAG: polyprenyl synthetase family protein [Caulobacteraceae bacterium]|nr:polyprenyl synthetase family protein [Caulobacter sp.]
MRSTGQQRFSGLRAEVDARLAALLPDPDAVPAALVRAAADAVAGPAKRLRPLLTLLSAEHFGAPGRGRAAALDAGCAVEFVHAASLILDDLPCMDDAALRRGRPAHHRHFGEDVTVLTAVALLNEAYAIVAAVDLPAEERLLLVRRLTEAVGFGGLVAGQFRDLHERAATDCGPLHVLNGQKTGCLFVAAVEAGAIAGGAPPERREAARAFGARLGEAFQILDDLLDLTSTPEAAGKDVRQDEGKATVVSLVGAEAARAEIKLRLGQALAELSDARGGALGGYVETLFRATPAAA